MIVTKSALHKLPQLLLFFPNFSWGLFTWSGGPRSIGVGFFCFHALGDTKQKKLTPLDRDPPLHVNRVLRYWAKDMHGVIRSLPSQNFDEISQKNFVKALALVYGHCFFDLSRTCGFRGETLHLLQECISASLRNRQST